MGGGRENPLLSRLLFGHSSPSAAYLNGGVVCVLVADEEGPLDGAAVGVDEVVPEDVLVDGDVVDVDGAVEGQDDHLGDLANLEVPWDLQKVHNIIIFPQLTHKNYFLYYLGSVGRAEAVWDDAL